jgi:hypothetical protein
MDLIVKHDTNDSAKKRRKSGHQEIEYHNPVLHVKEQGTTLIGFNPELWAFYLKDIIQKQ